MKLQELVPFPPDCVQIPKDIFLDTAYAYVYDGYRYCLKTRQEADLHCHEWVWPAPTIQEMRKWIGDKIGEQKEGRYVRHPDIERIAMIDGWRSVNHPHVLLSMAIRLYKIIEEGRG